MAQKYAIIGLGRFGMTLATELGKTDAEVIAIDTSQPLVEEVRDAVTMAVRTDSTDEKALRAQGVDKVDAAIVSIGASFEASVLTTVNLKALGVKYVVARATSALRGRILERVGADLVVYPEEELARNLARKLTAPHIIDYIELAEGHSMVQMKAPPMFHDKTLREIDLRKKYEVNIVAIRQVNTVVGKDGRETSQEHINDIPRPDDVIHKNDTLVLIGTDENLAKLSFK